MFTQNGKPCVVCNVEAANRYSANHSMLLTGYGPRESHAVNLCVSVATFTACTGKLKNEQKRKGTDK